MKKLTEEWLNAATDDLDVIARILEDAHLSHIVAFHAQQCIEKVFKALVEEHSLDAQKIHNLVTLYGKIEQFFPEEMDLQMIKTLDALYIEARYPGELGLLPNGRPTANDARLFCDFAKAVFERVSRQLRG